MCGNYWLGNDRLSQLTLTGRYKLRVDLQALDGSWYYAEYSSFVVFSEAHNYRLNVSGYTGNAGDAFSYSNGSEFTTYDRDNDLWSMNSTYATFRNNCALLFGGGCWYSRYCGCYFNSGRSHHPDFFMWTRALKLQTSRMWLKC